MTTCLIVCFYEGPRSGNQGNLYNEYLTTHQECLQKYKHSLTEIFFVISKDNIINTHVEKINNITYIYRKNRNLSFGGWVEVSKMFKDKFDYYIYCEDDYVFIKDNFDKIMIDQYNKKECDYMVTWKKTQPDQHPSTIEGGISTIGITTKQTLNKISYFGNKFNMPYNKGWAMTTFLHSFESVGCLDFKYNLFPYYCYKKDYIHFYGTDDYKNIDTDRIILCCYQYYNKNLNTT